MKNTVLSEEQLLEVGGIQLPLLDSKIKGKSINVNQLPITVTVRFAESHIPLQDILELHAGSVLPVGHALSDPLELVVNGQVIAYGQVVAIDNHYGLKITKVLTK